MAKKLLLNALIQVLGEFIELNEDNFDLNLAVWSGQIVLHDLKLKTDKLLRNLNLSILHGSIKTLEVLIPWTALLNSPVKIKIDGVYLQVGPLNVAALDKEATRKRVMALKQQKLRMADKFLDFSSGEGEGDDANGGGDAGSSASKGSTSETYVQAWTTKIVDNLEIKLRNIHARYEDSQTIPGNTYSAGVTLREFTLTTCDENWVETFVARVASSIGSSIHKLCKVENLGVYWSTRSPALAGLPFAEWEKAMQELVYFEREEPSSSSSVPPLTSPSPLGPSRKASTKPPLVRPLPPGMMYILTPTNKLSIKAIHNEKSRENVPQLDITVESTILPLALDGQQYRQLFTTLEMIGAVEKKRQPYQYKPQLRPTNSETARAWWKYACKLAIKRKRYIHLVLLSKTVSTATEFEEDSLSPAEREEMAELEERLPLHTLIIFRHLAASEMAARAEERRSLRQEQERTMNAGSRSWWGWINGEEKKAAAALAQASSKKTTSGGAGGGGGGGEGKEGKATLEVGEEEDVALSSIISAFEAHAVQEQKKKEEQSVHAVFIQLSLASSATLELAMFDNPILSASMSLAGLLKVSSTGITATFDLSNMIAIDRVTPNPPLPNLISVKSVVAVTTSEATGDAATAAAAAAAGGGGGGGGGIGGGGGGAMKKVATILEDGSSILQDAVSQTQLSVTYTSAGGRSTVRISALPLEFALNKICVQHLIGIWYWSNPQGNRNAAAAAAAAAAANAEKKRQQQSRKSKKDPTKKSVQNDDAFEFIFEAHAPKIIVPEDSSSDKGYLLLDTGYLVVRGFIGQDGMSWDISLKDINAGMPLSVNDMYAFGQQQLYLIKPFDISVLVQNIDKNRFAWTEADMTVDVDIKPEFRGELNASKLSRLLHVLGVISKTFFTKPDLLPGMPEDANMTSPRSSPLRLRTLSGIERSQGSGVKSSQSGGGGGGDVGEECPSSSTKSGKLEAPLEDSEDFLSPHKSLASPTDTFFSAEDGEESPSEDLSEESVPEIIQVQGLAPQKPVDGREPTHVGIALVIRMPVVALDLTYNVVEGHHLVLAVRTLETRLFTRPHDMQIKFNLSELSIEDSLRCLSQRDLARTPSEGPNLIAISYIYMYSRLSPCYKTHATEVDIKFANLDLNLDVNTLTHLRPFTEVLLTRRGPPPAAHSATPVLEPTQRQRTATMSLSGISSSTPNPSTKAASEKHTGESRFVDEEKPEHEKPPTGMHIVFTLGNVSLDILRTSESEIIGRELEGAFSLQITGLKADIDMQALLKSDVSLRSFEILDIRSLSRDYAIKKVFCPLADVEGSAVIEEEARRRGSGDEGEEKVGQAGSGGAESKEETLAGDEARDLLLVNYYQESPSLSYLKVVVLNTTSFVSTDTILDLANVVSANFFGILDLLANPNNAPQSPTSAVSPPPTADGDSTSSNKTLCKEDGVDTSRDISEGEIKEGDLFGDDEAQPESVDESSSNPEANVTYGTMIISINVTNPRLILVDDPTTEETQAIVGRCGIEIHYTRDTKIGVGYRELRESFHMSMKNLEVFALQNMLNWSPQPIMEPMGVEYNMRRESLNGKVIHSNTSIATDNANARVSVNDIVLAQSILTRRNPIESPSSRADTTRGSAFTGRSRVDSVDDYVEEDIDDDFSGASNSRTRSVTSTPATPKPAYTFSFHLGHISLVCVNDSHGQNVPVARMLLEETKFCIVGGGSNLLHGDGDFFASADFYNSQLSVWEPILDRWHPEMVISTERDENGTVGGVLYDIKSEKTMQVTVSGIMLETLLQTYSLLVRGADESTDRELMPDIMINNKLGEPLEIEVFDSISKAKLLALLDGHSGVVPKVKDIGNRAYANATHMPAAVDIHFTGQFGADRLPLYNLPFNINKPRTYHLHPKDDERRESGDIGAEDGGISPSPKRIIVIEPIVEEVYENARYDPISARWRQPFLLGDPYEWTDSSGTVRKEMSSVKLASRNWEWQEKWGVDMNGIVGEEFDQDGWEYSTAFGSFSIASKKRNKMPMDCVRRRRWTRTRMPTAASINERQRPLSLFWDVKPLKNGAKSVDIRSGMQIANTMPFSIMIALSNSAWTEDKEFGPILEGETFCVPLLCSYATSIMLKPSDVPYRWSQRLAFNIQTYDFRSTRDVLCEGPDLSPVCIRLLSVQQNKSLLVTCLPYLIIVNRLPCDLRFRCSSSDNKREEGELVSGARSKLAYMNLAQQPKISFTMGTAFPWSVPIIIDWSASSKIKQVELPTLRGPVNGVVISMQASVNSRHSVEVDVFCKSLVIDRTGLGISIWSQKGFGDVMMRHTFSRDTSLDHTIERKFVAQSVKKRLRALAKATARLTAKSSRRASLRESYEHEGVDHDDEGEEDGIFTTVSSPMNPTGVKSLAAGGSTAPPRRSTWSSLDETAFDEHDAATDSSGDLQAVPGYAVNEVASLDSLPSSVSSANLLAVGGEGVSKGALLLGSLTDLSVDSSHEYILTTANIGDLVYTDRNFTWSHIPQQLRGHVYVRTPCDDKLRRSRQVVRFTVDRPVLVLMLVDIRVKSPLKWLKEDKYRRVVDQAIARRVQRGVLQEVHFAIFGKHFNAGESVVLRGNWSKDVSTMYTAFIIPAPEFAGTANQGDIPREVGGGGAGAGGVGGGGGGGTGIGGNGSQAGKGGFFEQVTFEQRYDRLTSGNCWMEGSDGLSLFYSGDDVISVGVQGGVAWSEDIHVSMLSSSLKGSFEVVDWNSLKAYQLSYQMGYMPGLFSHTQQITVIPRFAIVNLMDEELMVVQRGSREINTYQPYRAEGWHKSDVTLGTSVQLRSRSSLWSLGTIDLNEIGGSVVHLPKREEAGSNGDNNRAIVLHVEVKVAEANENCSIVVIVWRATVEGICDMSIRNETNVHITVKQADINLDAALVERGLFEVCVAPGEHIPFGWADPDKGSNVLVTVGTTMRGPRKRIAKVSMLKAGELLRLPDNSGRSGNVGEVVLSVLAENGGRILRIARHQRPIGSTQSFAEDAPHALLRHLSQQQLQLTSQEQEKGYGINFYLASFGLSLVVEKPIRREFLSLYVDGLEGKYAIKDNVKSFEFMIKDMQIDNYSETVIHPVLFHSIKVVLPKKKKSSKAAQRGNPEADEDDEDDDEDDEDDSDGSDDDESEGKQEGKEERELLETDDTPLLQFTIIQEMPKGASTPIFKYVAFRILALSVEVDSATLQLLFTDLLNDLKFVSREQALASALPSQWIDEHNLQLLSPESQLQLVDVYNSKMATQTSKMYFEKFIVHPIKITFTFVQAPFPRKGTSQATMRSTAFNILTTIAGVEKLQLKLKSFEVEDALVSRASLQAHIINKAWQDLQGQLAQIAGSLAVLGSPMGFARKVGGGVKDLFYEPYHGAVQSPKEFVVGLGKGANSFFVNVVAGAMNSAVAFGGTASRGIGYLSGDGEYVRKRAIKRQRNRANQGGFVPGVKDGFESVASGFTSGMSGLVTRPFEEARKTGATGFLKGIGLGLLGAFVKPVMGITDGVTAVASGISQSVGKEKIYVYARPARALERSEADPTDLVIAALNLRSAWAQEFVIHRSKTNGYDDAYLSYIVMGLGGDSSVGGGGGGGGIGEGGARGGGGERDSFYGEPVGRENGGDGRGGGGCGGSGGGGGGGAASYHGGEEAIILSETYAYWRKLRSLWGRTWANISHCLFLGNAVGIMLYTGSGGSGKGDASEVVVIPCHSRDKAISVYAALAHNAHRMGNAPNVLPVVVVVQPAWTEDAEYRNKILALRGRAASLENELDGYRFGSANYSGSLLKITGPEADVFRRIEGKLEAGFRSWQELDEQVWSLLWEWDCTHKGLNASRCCATLVINRSDSPIQIARVQMVHGRNVTLLGSAATGYEVESRSIQPDGTAIVFIWAFPPSPIEIGHLKANINTAAFSAIVASTQRESSCEGRGGFRVGFLEKTVTDWWSKYVLVVS